MTATQAPTPGPLTALEAIAKDAAERVHKNGGCVPQLAFAPILFALQDAASSQTNELKPNDIAAILEENADADADGLHNTSQLAETIYRRFEAFRLAPTAPVEASGSELADAVARTKAHRECAHPNHKTMFVNIADLDLILSALRPLALGRQQGVVRWGLKDDNGVIQCLTYDDETSAEVAANRCSVRLTPFPLYTTPALAEAQDEGAAGEPVAWEAAAETLCEAFCAADPRNSDGEGASWPYATISERAQWASVAKAAQKLYAHPSPTPAADADRVRIAELEAERDTWKTMAENGAQALPQYVSRATAAEARADRLAKALERIADVLSSEPFDRDAVIPAYEDARAAPTGDAT